MDALTAPLSGPVEYRIALRTHDRDERFGLVLTTPLLDDGSSPLAGPPEVRLEGAGSLSPVRDRELVYATTSCAIKGVGAGHANEPRATGWTWPYPRTPRARSSSSTTQPGSSRGRGRAFGYASL